MRFPRLLAYPLALAVLAVLPHGAYAEDPPAPPPAVAKDDLKEIQPEFKKKIKPKNDPQFAKERAAYYETKGFKGSGLFYLGLIYEVAGDPAKTVETLEKFLASGQGLEANRESAMMRIMAAHVKLKDYDKALATGQAVLKAYPQSTHADENQLEIGRVYRRMGKDDEALAKFLVAAELKSSAGILDAVDVYLVAGDVQKAKDLLAKSAEGLKPAVKATLDDMRAFLDVVGTEAPPLTGARSPTGSEVPAKFGGGTWTVVYAYNLTMAGLERHLNNWMSIEHRWDKVEPWFMGHYIQWDPFTKKVDPTLTPEQEFDLQVKVFEKEGKGGQVLSVPKDLYTKFHFKAPGTRLILDPEGKFRWLHYPETRSDMLYARFAFERALDKFTGQQSSGSAPPAQEPAEPAGEGEKPPEGEPQGGDK